MDAADDTPEPVDGVMDPLDADGPEGADTPVGLADADPVDGTELPEGAELAEGAVVVGPDEMAMAFVTSQDSMAQIATWLAAQQDPPAEVYDPDTLAVVTEVLDDRTLFATGTTIRDLVDGVDDAIEGGMEGYGAARWFPFDTRDPESIVPLIGWYGLPAGTIGAETPACAVRLFLGPLGPTFEVVTPPGERVAAATSLQQFNERRKEHSPLRRRLLRVGGVPGALSFRVSDPPPVRRADVVLPVELWEQIERHVIAPLRATPSERTRAVLGSHSAVLIDGGAGTGKTILARALAADLVGEVTVISVEPTTARDALMEVYATAQDLSPALVVIEHAEAAAPARGTDSPLTIVQFSAAFDVAAASPRPIVTLMTTTEPTAVDSAFRQSSRIGITLHIPVPDHPLRRELLDVMLAAVADDGTIDVTGVDTGAIARVTDGATGADLQHLVRSALVDLASADGSAIDTDQLRRLAAARGWAAADTGMYL